MTIDCENGKIYNENGEEVFILSKKEINEIMGDKHLKGYIFDSLVYRYKYALELAVDARADEIMAATHSAIGRKEALGKARERNERDVLRFVQLLDEAIGEHD